MKSWIKVILPENNIFQFFFFFCGSLCQLRLRVGLAPGTGWAVSSSSADRFKNIKTSLKLRGVEHISFDISHYANSSQMNVTWERYFNLFWLLHCNLLPFSVYTMEYKTKYYIFPFSTKVGICTFIQKNIIMEATVRLNQEQQDIILSTRLDIRQHTSWS